MVLSQYEGTVSEKKQVGFPKKFREVLGETLVITKGFDGHLVIVSSEKGETLLEGTEGKPFIDKNTREIQRFLLGNAVEVVLDKKGRFVLPEYLKTYAGIEKNVVFVGVKRYVELWDKKKWEEQQAYLSEQIPSITERLTAEKTKHE